jgi:hypothetical protein
VKAYIVYGAGRVVIGRILERSPEYALEMAKRIWPHVKGIRVEAVKPKGTR